MTDDAPLALVTGGHRRLGGRISEALTRAGYALALHGSREAEPDAALAETLAQTGTAWRGFVADLAAPDAAKSLMAEVIAHFGRPPDLLVNNAAIFGQDRLENVEEADLARHYAVNCLAPVMLTRSFAANGTGERCIVNILDQRLANPHGDQLSYTLSKQALAGFTRIAARELAGKGIRVNAIAPGLTIPTGDYDPDRMDRARQLMPLRRLPQPGEIAAAVLYLAGAPSVSGQVIAVDGGAHMESYPRDFMYL